MLGKQQQGLLNERRLYDTGIPIKATIGVLEDIYDSMQRVSQRAHTRQLTTSMMEKAKQNYQEVLQVFQDHGCYDVKMTDDPEIPFVAYCTNLSDINRFCHALDRSSSSYAQLGKDGSLGNKLVPVLIDQDIVREIETPGFHINVNADIINQVKPISLQLVDNDIRVKDFFRCGLTPFQKRDDISTQEQQAHVNWKLWTYANRGNHVKVQECIDLGGRLDCYSGKNNETSPLHEASANARTDVCRLLCSKADVNWPSNTGGVTPLMFAATSGNWATYDLLVNCKVDIHKENVDGETTLFYAVRGDNAAICRDLLYRGAEVNILNKDGKNVLFFVRSVEVCKVLLEFNADATVIDKDGENVLVHAIETHSISSTVVEVLAESGADVNNITKDGNSLLHLWVNKYSGSEDECKKCFSLTKGSNLNLEVRDKDGLTPLHVAVKQKKLPLVSALLEFGADIHATDTKNGYTSLHYAVLDWSQTSTSEPLVRFLVEHHANKHAKDKEGNTAVHLCLEKVQDYRSSEAFYALHSLGFDFSDTNNVGKTAWHLFLETSNASAEKLEMLEESLVKSVDSNNNTLLHSLCAARPGPDRYGYDKNNETKALKILLEKGANISLKNKDGETPLHVASRNGKSRICKNLIQAGADVLAESETGDTPLHLAGFARDGGTIIELLIEGGADVLAENKKFQTPFHSLSGKEHGLAVALLDKGVFINAQDINGDTALHISLRKRRDTYDFMQTEGVNVCVVNKEGKTPLHYAAQFQGYCDHLLQKGASVDAEDNDGNTPLHMAAKAGNEDNCMLLIGAKANALKQNKAGERPLDLWQGSGEQRPRNLEKAVKVQEYEELKKRGETKLETVKLFLLGEPEAGKTTLKSSLIKEAASNEYIRTAGIDVSQHSVDEAGKFSIWDYAGQEEFHVTHSMFLGGENSIFLVMYDLSKAYTTSFSRKSTDQEKVTKYCERLRYWLSFIKAGNSPSTDKPRVVLVASHLDKVPDDGRMIAENILKELRKMFSASLNIQDKLVALDGRKGKSEEMKLLKITLKEQADEIRGERMVPTLCEDIKREMGKWCLTESEANEMKEEAAYPVMPIAHFTQKIKELDDRNNDEFIKTASEYLHKMGEIYLVKIKGAESLAVLDPQWLCTKVIGPTLARSRSGFPPTFKKLDKGRFTVQDVEELFPDFPNHKHLLLFLEQLELIYKLDEKNYTMPSQLRDRFPQKFWAEDPTKEEYYGRRIECKDETDIFSADVFPCLQVRLMRRYYTEKTKAFISQSELKFSDRVEGFVELVEDQQAIQYYVRNAGKHQRAHTYKILKEVEGIIHAELEERSPGTIITHRFLSSAELMKHRKGLVRSYTIAQLQEAVGPTGNGTVCDPDTGNTDEIQHLLCFGYDETFLECFGWDCSLEWMTSDAQEALSKALNMERPLRDDYRGLAEACGFSETQLMNIAQKCRNKESVTVAVLKAWSKPERKTVGDLGAILNHPGLVDNKKAVRALDDMMAKIDKKHHHQRVPALKMTLDVPLDLLAQRAALRNCYMGNLRQNMEADKVLLDCLSTLPNEVGEKLRIMVDSHCNEELNDMIVCEILKLKKMGWWDELMKAFSIQHGSTDSHLCRDMQQHLRAIRNTKYFK
ncbi:uncharacterized protein [Amphiura filiformis]|uniref:uncharacterized protein n=1 Tax=Amphiura filiformis TaxID=82378 RepID=UPI003B222B55